MAAFSPRPPPPVPPPPTKSAESAAAERCLAPGWGPRHRRWGWLGMGGVGAHGSPSPSSGWLQGPNTGRATTFRPPESGSRQRRERGGASSGSRAPSGPSPAVPGGPPLSIPRRSPPLPPDARVPAGRVLGSGELSPGPAQRRPATAGSSAGPLLMACGARSTAAAATAAPSSSSSSRAPSRDAATAPAPQPSSPPPPRPRTEPPPAPPRAQPSQRQPAPPSARLRGRRRRPPAPRSQPRCDAGRRARELPPLRRPPRAGTGLRGCCRPPEAFPWAWKTNPPALPGGAAPASEAATWRPLPGEPAASNTSPIPNRARKTEASLRSAATPLPQLLPRVLEGSSYH